MKIDRVPASDPSFDAIRHALGHHLKVISASTSLLQEEKLDGEQREYLQEIAAATREIQSLMDKLDED